MILQKACKIPSLSFGLFDSESTNVLDAPGMQAPVAKAAIEAGAVGS